jgi:phosphoribosylformylglycinamidine (FGAM) synthase-like enzyme
MQTSFKPIINAEPKLKTTTNFSNELLKVLERQNITSYDFISSQYDHEVQGNLY